MRSQEIDMTRQSDEAYAPQAVLDLTPLIGVLLVVLCIFMLAIPQRTDAALGDDHFYGCVLGHEPVRQFKAELAADGTVEWQGQRMDTGQFDYWLRHHRENARKVQILLRVDDDAPYQRVVDMLALGHRNDVALTLVHPEQWR